MLILFWAIVFLIGSSILSGSSTALVRIGRLESEERLKKLKSLFFFQHFIKAFYGKKRWDAVLYCISFTKQLFRLGYALSAFFYLLQQPAFSTTFLNHEKDPVWILILAAITIGISLLAEFVMNLLAVVKPRLFFSVVSPILSLLLTSTMILTVPIFRLFDLFHPSRAPLPSFRMRDKILEMLQESEVGYHLDLNEQKLILSMVSFKDRFVREVMVPRINVFSLPSETTVQEAASRFLEEGYSRIPVYKDNVDHIIGVLLYKDVLKTYAGSQKLQTPIENLVKPVLYTPETKKISYLLQEFRNKQTHLAIVVDEYGGTEGIVTIEDILEELVGEIADEYDIGEEVLYTSVPGGGWIVDAQMTIVDVEEDLGIKIPPSPEYDTIGGYIYHKAGAIPSKGWRIHHDDFDLEILSSDERSIDKVRITPI